MTSLLLTLTLLLTLATTATAGLLLEIRPVLLDSGAPVEDDVLWQTTLAAPAPGSVGYVSVPTIPLAIWSGQTLALVLTTTENEGAWWAGGIAAYPTGTPFVGLAADPYWQGMLGHDFGFALCVGDGGYDPCTEGPAFLPDLVSVWAPLQPGIGWAQTFLVEADGMLEGVSVLLAGSEQVPSPPTWLLLGLGGLLVFRLRRHT